jgi:hypothetical protein
MPYETLIVAYDSNDKATAAVKALRRIGVPARDIKRHPVSEDSSEDVAAAPEPPTGKGFFAWLFGNDVVEARIKLYQKALEAGGTVISVSIIGDEADRVRRLLKGFEPLDLEVVTEPN